MRHSFFFGLTLLASAGLLSSCAADRDIDDYRRDKLAQELAKMEPVVGTFSGELRDSQDRSVGILVLSLDRNTPVVTNPSTSRTERVAAMIGTLNLYGARRGSLEIYNGFFDDKRGEFQASASSASLKASGIAPMTVSARLDGETLVGAISPEGYSKNPAHFVLRKGAAGAEAQALTMEPNTAWRTESYGHTYEGKGKFRSFDERQYKKEVATRMIITDGIMDSTDAFLTALSPRRNVKVVVQRLDVDLRYIFSNAIYDTQTQSITGITRSPSSSMGNLGDPIEMILNCQILAKNGDLATRWGCRLESTGAGKFGELDASFVE